MPGLVYRVKTPKAQVFFADKQLVPNPSLRQTHREWRVSEPREPQELVAS
jgi:hypothetical protein